MPLLMFFEALGGLGLLIIGMKTMTEGLQRLAGERIRRFLEKLAGNRFNSALLGSGLTALLQSGGAASIVIIGFVNAGLLSLYQALGMLIGTGLGTTFVVQMITFKVSFVAAPGIFAGAILKFFSKRRRWVHLGEIILGLSLLFFGLHTMEANFSVLKDNAIFAVYQAYFPSWRIFDVLLGAILTFLVQSGSASIGIIMAMASGGLLPVETAAAMVLGEALGTTWLAAIGTVSGTMAAKRAVLIYFIMAVFLLLATLLMFPLFLRLVLFFTSNDPVLAAVVRDGAISVQGNLNNDALSRFLANVHTMFSVTGALLFLPLIGFFTRSAVKILPGFEKDIDMEPRLKFVDFRVINTPVIAFSQARNEIRRMAELTRSMFAEVMALFAGYDARKTSSIIHKESVLDALQKDISGFLVTLARQPLTSEISVGIPAMLQTVSGLEGIGDHAESVLECMRRKKEGNVYFSDTAMIEIKEMGNKVCEMLNLVVMVFDDPGNVTADKACLLHEIIKKSRVDLKKRHTGRLSDGSCSVIAGLLYMDIISAFERIGELSLEIIEDQRGSI